MDSYDETPTQVECELALGHAISAARTSNANSARTKHVVVIFVGPTLWHVMCNAQVNQGFSVDAGATLAQQGWLTCERLVEFRSPGTHVGVTLCRRVAPLAACRQTLLRHMPRHSCSWQESGPKRTVGPMAKLNSYRH
jgi:hypothetical protein